MQKQTFQELKDLFLVAKAPKRGKIGKHQASKRGYKHCVNLSKGELNSLQNKKFKTVGEILTLKELDPTFTL